MPEFSPTERIGVNAVEKIFLKDFKWIFREQPISDMGIDAHAEISQDGKPTGKLIAIQIKSGSSHFISKDDVLIYYGELRHLEYWTNHSLPVLLIAHLPETDETYWVLVSSRIIVRTKKQWKIEIPRNQVLSKKFSEEISKIGSGTEEMIKKRKLFIDKPIMDALKKGLKVSVVFMDWINKSLNRTSVKIIISGDGKEKIEREWGIAYASYENEEMMRIIFPWANISIDADFYEDNLDEDSLSGMYSLSSLLKKKIYPYNVQSNEVANYRLELSLNELGNGFLAYVGFVDNGLSF